MTRSLIAACPGSLLRWSAPLALLAGGAAFIGWSGPAFVALALIACTAFAFAAARRRSLARAAWRRCDHDCGVLPVAGRVWREVDCDRDFLHALRERAQARDSVCAPDGAGG